MGRLLTEFALTEYFDLVVTSFDILRPKPYPDALLKILEFFEIESHVTPDEIGPADRSASMSC